MDDPRRLMAEVTAGNRRALARALSLVEDRRPGFEVILREAVRDGMASHRVGFTGAPGVGKSSLVAALTTEFRRRGQKVAVLAVDPTSPVTGGALLGDRVRMGSLVGDPDVFIRSQASRGCRGGLSPTAGDALDVLAAAGFDLLALETVGSGQVDVDVSDEVDTCLLVLAPGAGDGIQALKSGVLEVADFWVVNKGDLHGADALRLELIDALSLRAGARDVDERVCVVSSVTGDGLEHLHELLRAKASETTEADALERRSHRLRRRLDRVIAELLEPRLRGTKDAALRDLLEAKVTVYDAARRIVTEVAMSLRDTKENPS